MFTKMSDIDRMFDAMDLFRSKIDRLFNDFDRSYGYGTNWMTGQSLPRTNLYENGDIFEIRAEVPGLDKEDLNVKIQGNYLEISGTRNSDSPQGYSTHRTERESTSFSRSFTLPTDVNVDKVEANIKNGVLYLTLPKSEAARPKQITVS